MALFRVRERVKAGGHCVPDETIKRRYVAGLKNFFNLYCPLTDSWQFYDNSYGDPSLIASGTKQNETSVLNEQLWAQLLETFP